ncbi:carboxymuconolactone decarboxylase family protein [bacterium]|nr:carboxymuconolactone decarboxylase family protein [bacterium]
METNFPQTYEHISKMMGQLGREIPETLKGFMSLHQASGKDGALSKKVKELIALSIAVTVRCDGCIAFHVHDAIAAGATKKEMLEAIGMAIVMGGGPSLMYGIDAYEAIEQFEKEKLTK